ncbi:MAG: GNAT family N-acetyltransferase [Candidatus Hodarchaeota archaeon]
MVKELPRIIEWKKTPENASKLADCYNKWDDDDSWPGGFNQGIKFTTERILERPVTPMIAYVAVNDDKFVGYIDVYQHGEDKNTLFVGLLGVTPQFQGRGYGRDLLKKSTRFAAGKPGITHLELDTWAGNTKSVPVYKRTGYKWVPGSDRVVLENFLPLILNFAPFKEYFAANDYYSTMKVEIQQEPDIERFENMKVFTYRFENDGGEKVTIIIDRYSKNITGFTIKDQRGEIGAWCLLSSHEGFVGYGTTTITWKFQNTSECPLSVNLSARGTEGVMLEPVEDLELVVPAGEIVEKVAKIKLTSNVNVRKIQQEVNPKPETLVISDIKINERSFQFKTAHIPFQPFKISSFPEIPTLTAGVGMEHELQLKNMTSDNLKMKIQVLPLQDINIELLSPKVVDLEPKSSVYLKLKILATRELKTGISKVPLNLELIRTVKEQNRIFREQFLVFNSRDYQAHGYCNCEEPTSEPLFLQNSFLRVNFNSNPPYGISRFDNLMSGHFTGFYGPNIDLGPPYEGFMNEWRRPDKEYEFEMKEDQSKASFIFRARSTRFPIMLEREATMHSGFPGLQLRFKLRNISEKEVNINLKSDFGFPDVFNKYHICPLKDGITVFNTGEPNYPKTIKNPNDFFAENWYSSRFSTGTSFGVIWEESANNLTRMELHQGNTDFRWENLTIPPGDSVALSFKIIMTQGNWEEIRGNWLKERGRSIKGPYHSGLLPRESVNMEIYTKSSHQGLLDKSANEINVRVATNGDNSVNGKLHIKLKGKSAIKAIETTFPVEELTRNQPLELTIPVEVQECNEQEILQGHLILQTRHSDIVKSCQLLFFPQQTVVMTGPKSVGEEKQYSINNGTLFFNVDTIGSINFLNLVNNPENLLESRFPNRNATFVFFNPFIGGIVPLVKFFGSRETEILTQEQARFQIKEIIPDKASSWHGVKAQYATASYRPGIGLTVEHLTMPGTNFIKSIITLENHKDEFLLLRFGFFAFLTAKGGKSPKAELFNSQGQLVQRVADQYAKQSRNVPCIQTTTRDPNTKLGFIADGYLHGKTDYFSGGDKLHCIRVYTGHRIEPRGKGAISMYTVLLKANEKASDYLFLREEDASKYPENGSDCLEIMDFPVFYY